MEDLIEVASAQVNSPKSQMQLARAQAHHVALRPFSKMIDIVMYIQSTEGALEIRDSILYALLEECQKQSETEWGLTLVAVMEPMLRRLRARIIAWCVEPMDLDQMIIELFWKEIQQFDLTKKPNRVLLRLRQRVQRQVFRLVNQEQSRYREHEQLREHVKIYQFNPFEEIQDEDQSEVMVDILMQSLDGVLPKEKLDLIAKTTVQKHKLRDYVKNFSDEYEAEADQERRYQSLKRKRSRVLRKMQTVLLNHIGCDETFVVQ